jgi:hypothetical protein
MTPAQQYQVLMSRDTGALGLDNASNRFMLASAIAVSGGVAGVALGAGFPILSLVGIGGVLYFGGLMVVNPTQ